MATQDAIDKMAEEFRDGRKGLIEYLEREARQPTPPAQSGSINAMILEVWHKSLPIATGRPLDFFLSMGKWRKKP